MLRPSFPTDQVIKFLTGDSLIYGALQDALLGRPLTRAQHRRSRDVCVAELVHNQHPLLEPATGPEPYKRPLRFMMWSESIVNVQPTTCVHRFTPARNFALRDILFVVFYGSLAIDDAQKVNHLLEFLLDVPNEPSFASQDRRRRASEALLLRLRALQDVVAPAHSPSKKQQAAWLREQERRLGTTTMLVTALPPTPDEAQPDAGAASREGVLIPMHGRREPMYA